MNVNPGSVGCCCCCRRPTATPATRLKKERVGKRSALVKLMTVFLEKILNPTMKLLEKVALSRTDLQLRLRVIQLLI